MSSIMNDGLFIGSCIAGSIIIGVVLGIISYVYLRRNPFPEEGGVEEYCHKLLKNTWVPPKEAPASVAPHRAEAGIASDQPCCKQCWRVALAAEEAGMSPDGQTAKEKGLNLAEYQG